MDLYVDLPGLITFVDALFFWCWVICFVVILFVWVVGVLFGLIDCVGL